MLKRSLKAVFQSAIFCGVIMVSGIAFGQNNYCNCITAWQQQTAPPVNCPAKDSMHRFDRSGNSYVLFIGKDKGAEDQLAAIAAMLKACIGKDYKVVEKYDAVQMNKVFVFTPNVATNPRMELYAKNHATQAAALLRITGAAQLPNSDSAFKTATQVLLDEWAKAIRRKKDFKGPSKGWEALYPNAKFIGDGAFLTKGGKSLGYTLEWTAADGDGIALLQGLLKALKDMPMVSGNAMAYSDEVPGKTVKNGFKLMQPNPPIIIELNIDQQLAPNKVKLQFIEQ